MKEASRPTIQFFEMKTPGQQFLSTIFRLRDLFILQRTQIINVPSESTSLAWRGTISLSLAPSQARADKMFTSCN